MLPIDQQIPIHKFLPHLEPMLLVDYICDMTENFVQTHFEISENCLFVENNFLSEVALIENAAQTCSCILGQNYYLDNPNPDQPKAIGFISTIKSFSIFKLPQLKSWLETKASLKSKIQLDDFEMCTISVETFCQNELIAKGEINLILQDY